MNTTSSSTLVIHSAPRPESDNPNTSNKVILRESGFEQPWYIRLWPLILALLFGVVYVAAEVVVWQKSQTDKLASAIKEQSAESKAPAAAAALFALGAFYIGYHQWRAARRESAMDQYYGRLETANQRLGALPGIDPMELYVFAELDNLEYVIEKYRLDYMDDRQALRGLEAFQRRLYGYQGARFAALAERSLTQSGYNRTTIKVAEKVINLWKEENLQAYEDAKRALHNLANEHSRL